MPSNASKSMLDASDDDLLPREVDGAVNMLNASSRLIICVPEDELLRQTFEVAEDAPHKLPKLTRGVLNERSLW